MPEVLSQFVSAPPYHVKGPHLSAVHRIIRDIRAGMTFLIHISVTAHRLC